MPDQEQEPFTPAELRALARDLWERDFDADEATVARDRRVARALELAATQMEQAADIERRVDDLEARFKQLEAIARRESPPRGAVH